MIFQVINFVEWAAASKTDTAFDLCVWGRSRSALALLAHSQHRRSSQRPIRVRAVTRPEEGAGCRALFLTSPADLDTLRQWSRPGLLTVGEQDGFSAGGGMMNLTAEQGRIVLELNPVAAEIAGIHFTAQLSRLARIVAVRPPAPSAPQRP